MAEMYYAVHENVNYYIVDHTLVAAKIHEDGKGFEEKITIPHEFPSGEKIDTVASDFLNGSCHMLVFSDGIKTIEAQALLNADIREVFWPSSCDTIPEYCFQFSHVEKLHNIDHVVNIGRFAFASSHIKEISWPSACPVIPRGCFFRSNIVNLNNIKHITCIKALAFSNVKHLQALDLSQSMVSDIENGTFWGLTRKNVLFPYYFPADRIHDAFSLFTTRG